MSTISTPGLNEMLREYAPHTLIQDMFKKDNLVWDSFAKDKSWKNGVSYQIPWELSSGATDMEMGQLVAETELNDLGTYKKAVLTNQPELWGALKLTEKDLSRYGDLRQSFLKVFPEKLEALIETMKMNVACVILRGGAIALATSSGTNAGVLKVDKPQFLSIGQRVLVKDNNTNVVAYVKQINMNTKEILFHDGRSAGSNPVDLSGITVAAGGKVAMVGSDSESFTSLVDYLLPASLGGKDTIHNVAKLSSPLLQPQVIDGSSMTSGNVLDKLYDHYFEIKELGKVKEADMWVPYSVFKHAVKQQQASKRYIDGGKEAGYGFSRIKLIGPEGEMTLTALAHMPANLIYMNDKKDFKFVGDTFFDRKRQLNTDEFFTIRKQSGYEYVVDICARFEFVATKLSSSAVIHSINV